jgi:hypothetical protein
VRHSSTGASTSGIMRCVTSWRDAASQQAQDDLDGLLNAALPFAQQMLERHGEFFPYGVTLGASGDTRMVAGQPGQGERPPSTEVLALLVEGLRRERETLRLLSPSLPTSVRPTRTRCGWP